MVIAQRKNSTHGVTQVMDYPGKQEHETFFVKIATRDGLRCCSHNSRSDRFFLLDAKPIEKLLGDPSQLLDPRIIGIRYQFSQTPTELASTAWSRPRGGAAVPVRHRRVVAMGKRLSILGVVHDGKHRLRFVSSLVSTNLVKNPTR